MKSLPKPAGVLEHCREGETDACFSIFFGNFRYDQILKETKDTNIHFFIHSSNFQKSYQGIPENYTSEL